MLPNRKIDGKHSWTHLNIYTIWYNVYLGRLATRAKSPLAHPLPCDLRANCTPDRESSSYLPRPLQPLVDQNGPCHQGWVRIEFGYPTKKIKRCKAIRTMMVAKYLHCCFVFIVVFFQVHRQGSDSGTFLKNRIHKLAKDFFGPACLTCLIMILIFQSKMFESICLDCFAIQLALGSKYAT